MNEQQRLLKQMYALKADLEKLGCKVEISIKPHVAGTAYRVTEQQRAILGTLARYGKYTFRRQTRSLIALQKKGLVTARLLPPLPGNDYSAGYEYRLTEAGKVVVS